jgi:hypothetical protein
MVRDALRRMVLWHQYPLGMPLPRGQQVPITAGLSGAVFVAALFSLATPLHELFVFSAWGLIYALECVFRDTSRVRPIPPSRSAPIGAENPAADGRSWARTMLPYALALVGYVGLGIVTRQDFLSFTWGVLYFVLVLGVAPRLLRRSQVPAVAPVRASMADVVTDS